jgi:hypothetical protein
MIFAPLEIYQCAEKFQGFASCDHKILTPKLSIDVSKWLQKVPNSKFSNWHMPLKGALQANSSIFST